MQQYFSEYFRPTDEEKKRLWGEAVFVFDTNVLLNLYRLSRKVSLEIVDVLKKLKGRLFLPHQVAFEFFKHREEAIADQINAFDRARQALIKIPEKFKQEFPRHPCIPIGGITDALKKCTDKQITVVRHSQQENQLNFFAHDDPILPILDALFTDCSEGPYQGTDDDALNNKVEERVRDNLPPCFVSTGGKASAPPANNPHRGDGRVWFQIVNHAAVTKKPIIFVTADQKANWWRTAKLGNEDRAIGPHFQLIRDVESTSGKRFLMYTQEGFLSEAPKYLEVADQTQAIEEVKQIQESDATDEGMGSVDEPKTSPLEESKSETKAEALREFKSSSSAIGMGLADVPKTSPLEESTVKDHAESNPKGD